MFNTSTLTNPEHAGKTLGAFLLSVREERGLPIEQAAHDTRIRAQRLREIENDDLSHFSHPSYARLFLVDYAKYLGVPFQEIRSLLPDVGECGSEGYQYLQDVPGEISPVRAARSIRPRRLVPVFAAAAVFLVCVLGAFQLWITLRNIDRLGLGAVTQTDRAELDRASAEPVKAVVVPAAPEDSELNPVAPAVQPQAEAAESAAKDRQSALFVGGIVAPANRVQ